ncbi:hypothetical protein ACOSP7_001200 [Xanthoceras sorbifolium]
MVATAGCTRESEMVQAARAAVLQARNWARAYSIGPNDDLNYIHDGDHAHREALRECAGLYEVSESRLAELLVGGENYTVDDARAWLSGVLAYHSACLDGLEETGFDKSHAGAQNLSVLVGEALSLYAKHRGSRRPSANSKADFVVAHDGSAGTHKTINGALAALTRMGQNRPQRVIIYVKSGICRENVEIQHHMKNLMFVGDGTDKTIVTGSRNVPDGTTTTGIWGDGFWARDMTFENTVGPHQAVALRVASDLSVIYRCSFKAYQDTLFTLSLRQFYRDCHIYGTINFIFGDVAAVFQNCDIFVRRLMDHQANMITAQGRDHPESNTGISIIGSFALSTLYYAEYLNKGVGALTANRVKWNGFHVLNNAEEASPFTVSRFIHGENWIPETGVPFSLEI